jgi:hypothetical protein
MFRFVAGQPKTLRGETPGGKNPQKEENEEIRG